MVSDNTDLRFERLRIKVIGWVGGTIVLAALVLFGAGSWNFLIAGEGISQRVFLQPVRVFLWTNLFGHESPLIIPRFIDAVMVGIGLATIKTAQILSPGM